MKNIVLLFFFFFLLNSEGIIAQVKTAESFKKYQLQIRAYDYDTRDDLEGTYINEFGEFNSGTYLRLPKENESFVKSNNPSETNVESMSALTKDSLKQLAEQAEGLVRLRSLFFILTPENRKAGITFK